MIWLFSYPGSRNVVEIFINHCKKNHNDLCCQFGSGFGNSIRNLTYHFRRNFVFINEIVANRLCSRWYSEFHSPHLIARLHFIDSSPSLKITTVDPRSPLWDFHLYQGWTRLCVFGTSKISRNYAENVLRYWIFFVFDGFWDACLWNCSKFKDCSSTEKLTYSSFIRVRIRSE